MLNKLFVLLLLLFFKLSINLTVFTKKISSSKNCF